MTRRTAFVTAMLVAGLLLTGGAVGATFGGDDAAGAAPLRSDEPPPLPGDQPVPLVEVRAQIVSVDLAIAESFPQQYFVGIVSAQPNGCTRFSLFEVVRHGTEIEITVWNTVPKDLAAVLCAAVYSTTQSNVPLGSNFESGTQYTLSVNGQSQTFVAQ